MKKITYGIVESEELEDDYFEIILFLEDITGSENFFIEWCHSAEKMIGTNISELSKLSNDMIEISFPILSPEDEDTNPYIISKKKFIKFMEDWRDFGKSRKKYIYLKKEREWYIFEDVPE